jgi:protein-L-isoaspartate(D-aspartate) O-methyltransferase
MRIHRWPWWQDGDQEFLSEWVDASAELDYRTTQRLRRELFDPIVTEIANRYSYRGVARDYFMRAVDEQIDLVQPKRMLHQLGLWHLWTELTDSRVEREKDTELGEIARMRREEIVRFPASARVIQALVETPRELFVRAEDIGDSAEDRALALTDDGKSTISALHAYAMAFDALGLGEGDALVELGAGSGYGVAVAQRVVGERGRVLGLEIVPELVTWASEYVGERVICADAHDVTLWKGATKVSVAFAVDRVPDAWLDALAPGGKLVAPVGSPQMLTCYEKLADGAIRSSEVGAVRYVRDRRVSP